MSHGEPLASDRGRQRMGSSRHLTAPRPRFRTLGLLAVLGLAGCGSLFGPDDEEVLGRLTYFGHPSGVHVPDTVTVGVPFEVSVRTYGGGCISFGRTSVEYASGAIDIRPYDVDSLADVCNDELIPFEHTAEVTVNTSGPWVVRFHGREVPPDSVIVIERAFHAR